MAEYRDFNPRYPLLARVKEPPRAQPTGFERPPLEEIQPPPEATPQYYQPLEEEPPKRSRTGLIVIIIIVVIVVLIAAAAAVYFFYFRNRGTTTTGTGTGGEALGVLNESCASKACAPIFTCDPATTTCKSNQNGPCINPSDCFQSPFAQTCTGTGGQGGQCRRPNGTACSLPGDCASGFCAAGICTACTIQAECQTGQNCVSNVCQ